MKENITRFLAGLTGALLLLFPLLSLHAQAAGDGRWKLTEHIVTDDYSDFLPAMSGIREAQTLEVSGENGTYRKIWKAYNGGATTGIITGTVTMPAQTYRPGDTISLHMTLDNQSHSYIFLKCFASPGTATGGNVILEDPSPTNPYGWHRVRPIGHGDAKDVTAIGKVHDYATDTWNDYGYEPKTFQSTAPDPMESGNQEFSIVVSFDDAFYEAWIYTWSETADPVYQDEIITKPPDKPGEFQGDNPINKIIITGIGGAIAAAGGAAAANSGRKKK